MKIFAITACYNFDKYINQYVNSLITSWKVNDGFGLGYQLEIVFVNDGETGANLIKDVASKLNPTGIKFHVLDNGKNLGCTTSRNNAVRYILNELDWSDDDRLIQMDVDELWSINAISNLLYLRDLTKYDVVLFPRTIESRAIPNDIYGEIKAGEYASKCDVAETSDAWKLSTVRTLWDRYDRLWCDGPDKYYPEDMVWLENPDLTLYVELGSRSINVGDYATGNITKDFRNIWRSNRSAYNWFLRLHKKNSLRYKYSEGKINYLFHVNAYCNSYSKDEYDELISKGYTPDDICELIRQKSPFYEGSTNK